MTVGLRIGAVALGLALAGCSAQPKEEPVNEGPRTPYEMAIARIDPNAPPDTAEEHYERGLYYTQNHRTDLALVQFYKAVEKDESHAGAHSGLAYCYLTVKRDVDMAGYHWERSLALRPSQEMQIDAHMGLGQVYTTLGLRRQEEETHPELVFHRYDAETAKQLRSSAEWFDQAESHYRQVLSLSPQYRQVLFNLGVLSSSRGDFSAAMGYYRKYLDTLDPSEMLLIRRTYMAIATVHESQGDLFKARDTWKECLKTVPEHSGDEILEEERSRILAEISRVEQLILAMPVEHR